MAPAPITTASTVDSTVGWKRTVGAYVALTKPRIIELLLVTTVPVMVLAARGWPSGWTLLATLVGGTLAAGSANTINCVVDRDIDAVMARTRRRPMVRAQISTVAAMRFGVALDLWSKEEFEQSHGAVGALEVVPRTARSRHARTT